MNTSIAILLVVVAVGSYLLGHKHGYTAGVIAEVSAKTAELFASLKPKE